MNPFTLFTMSGPLLGTIGWFLNIQWLLWIGVVLAVINLVMNIASGAMKLPVFPVMFMLAASVLFNPWYIGVGVGAGLLIWTAIESVGELFRPRSMGE
jgi:hypothetical protein